MIKEVTRRVNLQNIWQAYYTSGEIFPHPFATAAYFHRTLNPVKNVKVGFSGLRQGETIETYAKKMRLPDMKDINLVGDVRAMKSADIP